MIFLEAFNCKENSKQTQKYSRQDEGSYAYLTVYKEFKDYLRNEFNSPRFLWVDGYVRGSNEWPGIFILFLHNIVLGCVMCSKILVCLREGHYPAHKNAILSVVIPFFRSSILTHKTIVVIIDFSNPQPLSLYHHTLIHAIFGNSQ